MVSNSDCFHVSYCHPEDLTRSIKLHPGTHQKLQARPGPETIENGSYFVISRTTNRVEA